MMWLASLLVLIYVKGSYGDFDCFRAQESRCEGFVPKKFPETPEELLKTCRTAEQLGSCIADVRESCNYLVEEAKGLRHAVDYMSTTCQKCNPIFEVLSSKLDCIQMVGREMDESCYLTAYGSSTMETIREHLKPLLENEANQQLKCLTELMFVGCRAMKYEHCGYHVGEAMTDVLMNITERLVVCTPKNMEEVFRLLEGQADIFGEEMEQWLRKRRGI